MFYRLPPPPDALEESDRAKAVVQSAYQARKARLSKTRRQALDKKIRKMVEQHERSTSSLRGSLRRMAEFLDGKPESTDFPFGADASSQLDIRLAAAYVRTLRAAFVKAIWSDPGRAYVAVPLPGASRAEVNEVEAGLNWTAEYDCNFNDTLKDTIVPAFRDRLALIHGQWVRRIEHGCDYRTYVDAQTFQADYPDAYSADLSEEEYLDILNSLFAGFEVQVEYPIDFLAQNEPEFTVFPLAKFIWAPLFAQDLEKMQLYGYRYTETPQRFNAYARYGYYDADVANEVRKRSSSDAMPDDWDSGRDQIEGINAGTEETRYQLAYLVVSEDLDLDGIPEKYVVIWDLEKHRSLRWEHYSVRRNIPCIVPFRLVRQPDGRFLGTSLLEDNEHLFREVNALHRSRSNQRRITDSVTLLFPDSLREKVDLGAEYSYFVPGRVLYLPDNYMRPDVAPRQLVIQDTSRTQTSLDEEGIVQRYIDFKIGVGQAQSGKESPQDPSAPAAKTAMLLQRGDLRVEDLVDEWKRTVPEAIDLLRALYFQNAGSTIAITTGYEGEQERTIETRSFASPKVRGALKPIKPSTAPEVEMQRISTIAVALQRFPFVVQLKPMAVVELWNDFIAASRVERPERFQIQMAADGMAQGSGGPVDLAAMLAQMASGTPPGQPPGKPAGPGGAPPQAPAAPGRNGMSRPAPKIGA